MGHPRRRRGPRTNAGRADAAVHECQRTLGTDLEGLRNRPPSPCPPASRARGPRGGPGTRSCMPVASLWGRRSSPTRDDSARLPNSRSAAGSTESAAGVGRARHASGLRRRDASAVAPEPVFVRHGHGLALAWKLDPAVTGPRVIGRRPHHPRTRTRPGASGCSGGRMPTDFWDGPL
jgi:hypothetical protein